METRLSIGARVKHPSFGEGIVSGLSLENYSVFFKDHGDKEIARDYEGFEVLSNEGKTDNSLSLQQVEDALAMVLQRFADFTLMIPLAEKWKGGKLVMQPGDASLQGKEIPIDTFFHKIVMVRDRLRVLEQQINAHKGLSDAEKVEMQQYITRIYGSLTTFNILFKRKEDYFVGESGKE